MHPQLKDKLQETPSLLCRCTSSATCSRTSLYFCLEESSPCVASIDQPRQRSGCHHRRGFTTILAVASGLASSITNITSVWQMGLEPNRQRTPADTGRALPYKPQAPSRTKLKMCIWRVQRGLQIGGKRKKHGGVSPNVDHSPLHALGMEERMAKKKLSQHHEINKKTCNYLKLTRMGGQERGMKKHRWRGYK